MSSDVASALSAFAVGVFGALYGRLTHHPAIVTILAGMEVVGGRGRRRKEGGERKRPNSNILLSCIICFVSFREFRNSYACAW